MKCLDNLTGGVNFAVWKSTVTTGVREEDIVVPPMVCVTATVGGSLFVLQEMNEIQLFNSPEFGEVRVVMNVDNEPMFCLVDVCQPLGLNPSKIAQRLTCDVLSKYPIIDALGREQENNFVNEDGLYDIIIDSRKAKAKMFRKWVTSEVLPSIRRTGGYVVAKQDDTPEIIMARAVMVAQDTIKRYEQRNKELASINKRQKEEILSLSCKVDEMKPKADYYDIILSSRGSMTATQVAKDYGMSPQELNNRLHALGVQYKVNGQWVLYAKYQGYGYTDSRTRMKRNCSKSWIDTMWTQKGRIFVYNLLKEAGVLPVIERYSGYNLPPVGRLKESKPDVTDIYRDIYR